MLMNVVGRLIKKATDCIELLPFDKLLAIKSHRLPLISYKLIK